MKLRNFLLIIVLSLFIFNGCKKDKDDNEDTTPVTPPVATETIIATASGTIGTAGGTVILSDGATVEIAADVFTSTALPGGYRETDGSFYSVGGNVFLWTSSPGGSDNAWSRYLGCGHSQVSRYGSSRLDGFSVRCVKNYFL
ncbi:MAG: hypothetical protein KA792_09230 [Bacteroidales bacterium]|nr:hypothetical protein [Bacteroidales bacterium]